jgi:hypothetical protein
MRHQRTLIAFTCCCLVGMVSAGGAALASGDRPVLDAGAVPALTAPALSLPQASSQDVPVVSTGSPPLGLTIDRLGGPAPVIPVGVGNDGLMVVPEDVDTVGWYRFGPAPGAQEGRVVLVGHRDARGQGRGFLHGLSTMQPGDRLTVDTEDGALAYVVTARTGFPRSALPAALFDRTGPAELILISCGGRYVPGQGYEQNVVVFASPEGTTAS